MTFDFGKYYTSPQSPTFVVGATEDDFPVFNEKLNFICVQFGLPLEFDFDSDSDWSLGSEEELDPMLEQFLRWMLFGEILNSGQLNTLEGSADIRWENATRQKSAVDAWNRAVTYWNTWAEENDVNIRYEYSI